MQTVISRHEIIRKNPVTAKLETIRPNTKFEATDEEVEDFRKNAAIFEDDAAAKQEQKALEGISGTNSEGPGIVSAEHFRRELVQIEGESDFAFQARVAVAKADADRAAQAEADAKKADALAAQNKGKNARDLA